MRIRVEGFFPIERTRNKEVIYPDFQGSLVLNPEMYQHSIQEFDLQDLEILDIERYWGGCIFGFPVVGVVNTKGSKLNPFFIEKQKASTLRRMALERPRPIRI